VSESACALWRSGYEPEVLPTCVKQKKDAEASLSNVAGTGGKPVSAAADKRYEQMNNNRKLGYS